MLSESQLPARYFERQLIHEFNDEGELVRLCRMTFTEHELRAISVMLNASLGVVGYSFTTKTIAEAFSTAWQRTAVRVSDPD